MIFNVCCGKSIKHRHKRYAQSYRYCMLYRNCLGIKRVNNSHLETSQFPIGRLASVMTIKRAKINHDRPCNFIYVCGPRRAKPFNDRCGTDNNREISIMSRCMKEQRLFALVAGRLCSKRNTQAGVWISSRCRGTNFSFSAKRRNNIGETRYYPRSTH